MRSRIFGALAFSALISWAMSACTSAGVSFVYMAIDTGGAQPRQTFYTDSTGVFCIAKYSAARQDATLDFVINQLTGSPWCSPSKVDTTDIHPVFWNGELTPGKGVESVAAMQLLATGMPIVHPCNGYCAQNLPAGNLCKGTGATAGSASITLVVSSSVGDG